MRFSVDMVHAALICDRRADRTQSGATGAALAGRLRATLSFSQIEEIMASGASGYVDSVRWQCAQAHTAIQQVYFDYSVESALVS